MSRFALSVVAQLPTCAAGHFVSRRMNGVEDGRGMWHVRILPLWPLARRDFLKSVSPERTRNHVTDPLSSRLCGCGKSPLLRRWNLKVIGKLSRFPSPNWTREGHGSPKALGQTWILRTKSSVQATIYSGIQLPDSQLPIRYARRAMAEPAG